MAFSILNSSQQNVAFASVEIECLSRFEYVNWLVGNEAQADTRLYNHGVDSSIGFLLKSGGDLVENCRDTLSGCCLRSTASQLLNRGRSVRT